MATKSEETQTQGDGVDYKQAKNDFMLLLKQWLNNQRNQRLFEIHCKPTIQKIIREHLFDNSKPASNYEVLRKGDKDILVLKKKNKSDPYVQIISWEDMFDLFMPIHVQSGHKGRKYLRKTIGNEYKYPTMCLSFFKRVCNICNPLSGISLLTSRTALVYVIKMVQIRKEENFRYLLIYSDKDTNYIVLRPLMEKTDLEISSELFRIFAQFGPPRRLCFHSYNSNLTHKIKETLKELCPEFIIAIEHKSVTYELPTIVTDKIQEWMNSNNSGFWEVGCYIVQKEMNNTPKIWSSQYTQFVTPHSLFYHTPISSQTEQSSKNLKKSSFTENTVVEESRAKKSLMTIEIASPVKRNSGKLMEFEEESSSKYDSEKDNDSQDKNLDRTVDNQHPLQIVSIKSESMDTAEQIIKPEPIQDREIRGELEIKKEFDAEEETEDVKITKDLERNIDIEECDRIEDYNQGLAVPNEEKFEEVYVEEPNKTF